MNEASALAVKVVVAAVREAQLFASLAALHFEAFERSINYIFFWCRAVVFYDLHITVTWK